MSKNEKEKRLMKYEERKEQEEKISNQALELMGKATEYSKIKAYDEALKLYNEAVEMLKEINWINQIQTVQRTINQLEIDRIHYLKSVEKQKIREEKQLRLEAEQKAALETKARKIKEMEKKHLIQFEEKKKREEQVSNQAYDLMEKAAELVKVNDYDTALNIYNEVLSLFENIKWVHEIQTTQKIISQIKIKKTHYFKSLDEKRIRKEQERKLKEEQGANLEENARRLREKQERERAEKISALEEEKEFKQRIIDMGEEADKIVREYEVEIKKGKFQLEPPYEQAIGIYRNLHQILLDRGWNEQARITSNQIKHLKVKIEQDKKLREVETEKIQKHQEYLDSLKFKKKEKDISEYERKKKEDEDFQNQIKNIMNEADKIAREYEIEFRKRGVELSCPYVEIIKKYINLKEMLKEKGWEGQINIINSQLKFYREKLEQDKKLREIEAQKLQKQKEYEEFMRIKKD